MVRYGVALGCVLREVGIAQLAERSCVDQGQVPANQFPKSVLIAIEAIPAQQSLVVHTHTL